MTKVINFQNMSVQSIRFHVNMMCSKYLKKHTCTVSYNEAEHTPNTYTLLYQNFKAFTFVNFRM